MKKTVKEWLQELPDGYRERALSQCKAWNNYTPDDEVDSIFESINRFCPWYDTTEGGDFWYEVFDHYKYLQAPIPPLPTNKLMVDKFAEAGAEAGTKHALLEENAQLKARIEELENMVLNVIELLKDFEKP